MRWPETIAALALIVQAFILGLQWRILKHHGQIMKGQADTAGMIEKVLRQLAEISSEQEKVLDAQFKFQKRIEVKG